MSDLSDEKMDPNWIRQCAAEEIEYLKFLRSASWEEHTHSYRWLMASLLAINGGALLTIFGSDKVGLVPQFYAASSFTFGIFCALIVAVLGQKAIQSSLIPIQESIGYWLATKDEGERVEEREQEIGVKLKKSASIAKSATVFGWISAASFLFGCLVVGYDWKVSIDIHFEPFILPT